jgi:hypothetical protein
MQQIQSPNNEAAILGRLLDPNGTALTPEAANAILALEFCQQDKERMNTLAAKARAGSLTAEEQSEIEAYSRVGSLLGILQSRARKFLKGRRCSTRAATSGPGTSAGLPGFSWG